MPVAATEKWWKWANHPLNKNHTQETHGQRWLWRWGKIRPSLHKQELAEGWGILWPKSTRVGMALLRSLDSCTSETSESLYQASLSAPSSRQKKSPLSDILGGFCHCLQQILGTTNLLEAPDSIFPSEWQKMTMERYWIAKIFFFFLRWREKENVEVFTFKKLKDLLLKSE